MCDKIYTTAGQVKYGKLAPVITGCPRVLTGSAVGHRSSNLGVGMSEGRFIFDFASAHLEDAWPI